MRRQVGAATPGVRSGSPLGDASWRDVSQTAYVAGAPGIERAGVVDAGRAPATGGVRVERHLHRQPLAGDVVVGGGAHGLPRPERRHRGVRPERERDAGGRHVGERVQGQGPLEAEALDVHAARATPEGVEDRLDRGVEREVRHPGDEPGVDHLGVLDAVARSAYGLETDDRGRLLAAGDDRFHRAVTDRVEAGLEPGARAGDDVVADLGGGEVRRAEGLLVGVDRAHAGGVRADGAVGEEVPGRTERTELARPLDPAELAPVADDVGAGLGRGEGEHAGEVVGAGDVRTAELVEGPDPELGAQPAGGPLRGRTGRRRDRVERRGPRLVVGLAGEQARRVVALEARGCRAGPRAGRRTPAPSARRCGSGRPASRTTRGPARPASAAAARATGSRPSRARAPCPAAPVVRQ